MTAKGLKGMSGGNNAEWGELLYEPEWLRHSRISNLKKTMSGVLVIAASTIFLFYQLSTHAEGITWRILAHVIPSIILGSIIVTVIFSIYRELSRHPFKVYRNGIRLPRMPVMRRKSGVQPFIPNSDIISIEIEARPKDKLGMKHLVISFHDAAGVLHRTSLEAYDIEDPLQVIFALAEIAPGRVGESASRLIEEGLTLEKNQKEGRPLPWTSYRRGPYFMIMLLFIPAMFLLMLTDDEISFYYMMLLTYYGFVFAIMWSLLRTEMEGYHNDLFISARVSGDLVGLPDIEGEYPFHQVRTKLRLSEVRKVQLGCDPIFYEKVGKILTVRDERLDVRKEFLDAFATLPRFKPNRGGFQNIGPLSNPGPPMIAVRGWRISVILVLYFSAPMILRAVMDIDTHSIAPKVLILLFFSMFTFMIYGSIRYYWTNRVSSGAIITDDGIRISTTWGGERRIPKRDIRLIRPVPTIEQIQLELMTDHGKVRLSKDLVKSLLKHGYGIEDKSGYLDEERLEDLSSSIPSQQISRDRAFISQKTMSRENEDPIAIESESGMDETAMYVFKKSIGALAILTILFIILVFMMREFLQDMLVHELPLPDNLILWIITFGTAFICSLLAYITLVYIRRKPQRIFQEGVEIQRPFQSAEFLFWTDIKGFYKWKDKGGQKRVYLRTNKGHLIRIDDRYSGFDKVQSLLTTLYGMPDTKLSIAEIRVSKELPGKEASELAKDDLKRLRFNEGFRRSSGWEGELFPMSVMALVFTIMFMMPGINEGFIEMAFEDSESIPPKMPSFLGSSNLSAGVYRDMHLDVMGNITVHRGELMELYNLTLAMEPFRGDEAFISVESGGRLRIQGSNIIVARSGMDLYLDLDGNVEILDCEFVGNRTEGRQHYGAFNVRVYSDDVLFSNVSFINTSVPILLIECSAVIDGCFFGNGTPSGIICFGGTPRILNSTFDRKWPAISLNHCDAYVEACFFNRTSLCIDLANSNPTIERCTFNRCYTALYLTHNSHPVLIGNDFGGVEEVKHEMTFFLILPLFLVGMFGTFAAALLVGGWIGFIKKRRTL